MEYDNDFLGSYADENVTFKTEIVKTAVVGDNYWKVMIFTNADCTKYDSDPNGWVKVPGQNAFCASMTTDDYTEYVSNSTLLSWCSDLFDPGFTGELYMVIPVEEGYDKETNLHPAGTSWDKDTMESVYNWIKPYAYHKTIFVPDTADEDKLDAGITISFADLCYQDKELLSAAPILPYTDYDDTTSDNTDYLYKAIEDAGVDAFFSAYMDATRNAGMVSLGIALSETNGSGTCVGNGIDMTSTSSINSSGEDGEGLTKSVRELLHGWNVQTWKPVGNNTGNVAAYGEKTLQGDYYVANWITCYIAYMVKVGVAELLTSRNFLKNEANYSKILSVMNVYLGKFGPSGSGRLDNLQTTAPAFSNLPETDGETLTIPNAWSAIYVGRLAKVNITGTLYLGD